MDEDCLVNTIFLDNTLVTKLVALATGGGLLGLRRPALLLLLLLFLMLLVLSGGEVLL